jgi:hypothetical protein
MVESDNDGAQQQWALIFNLVHSIYLITRLSVDGTLTTLTCLT